MISILDLFGKNPYSRVANSSLKSLEGVRAVIGEQLLKANKDYKVYGNKGGVNFTISKKTDRKKTNQTFALGRSLPKTLIGAPIL